MMDGTGPADPAPVVMLNPHGRSPFLLLGDHAGIAIPARLGTLGLGPADLARHIACDIGVRGLGTALADRLDAVFLHQRYSRLVVDCNRDPQAPDAVPDRADGTDIPGNTGLGATERAARVAAVHAPYQDAIAAEIARRGDPPILVSLHSFTPVMAGEVRRWDVGILHDGGEARFARAMLAVLAARGDLVVGDASAHNRPRRARAALGRVPEPEAARRSVAPRGARRGTRACSTACALTTTHAAVTISGMRLEGSAQSDVPARARQQCIVPGNVQNGKKFLRDRGVWR